LGNKRVNQKARSGLNGTAYGRNSQINFAVIILSHAAQAQFWREYDYPEGVSDPRRYNRGVDMSTIKKDNYGKFDY
jgi:hypothetical protein